MFLKNKHDFSCLFSGIMSWVDEEAGFEFSESIPCLPKNGYKLV